MIQRRARQLRRRVDAWIDDYAEFDATGVFGPSETQHFQYDHLDRLTHAWTTGDAGGAYDRSYVYDQIGNILAKGDTGSELVYGYGQAAQGIAPGAKPHAVTHVGGVERYQYSPNGNMRFRDRDGDGALEQDIRYTLENKVESVTVDGTTTTYFYDGNGVRVKKEVYDGLTYEDTYYVGGIYEEKYESMLPDPEVTKYYFAGSQRVAMRVSDGVSSTVTYLHGDHLGSTSLATDGSGEAVSLQHYYPYGETRSTNGTLPTDFQYTGQRHDSTIKLLDYNARWYDSLTGRFISPDTIIPDPANPQSLNRYSYVYNNPCNLVDPSGHCGEGSSPGEGVSQERHDRLCWIREQALALSERTGLPVDDPDYLTDVGAMALLFDIVAPEYSRWYGSRRADFVYDLGVVVGGIEVQGNMSVSYTHLRAHET